LLTRHRAKAGSGRFGDIMRRIFLFVVLLGIILLTVGFFALGAFPPVIHPQQIQKILPNDHFQTGK
jgi:hypothetical protein